MNIMLIALPEPILESCAAELAHKYNVQTSTVPIDLSKPTAQTLEKLNRRITGIQASENTVRACMLGHLYFFNTPQHLICSGESPYKQCRAVL